MSISPDEADDFRAAVVSFVAQVKEKSGGVVTYEQMCGFRYKGETIHIMTRPGLRGIMKPKGMTTAISIRTAYFSDPTKAIYDDAIGVDGYIRYKWQGSNPTQWDNVAVREALRTQAPLIWFRGVAEGLYDASPVYVVDEEVESQQFVLALDSIARELWEAKSWAPADQALRKEYALRLVRDRVHQPAFRQAVLSAYAQRCALCRLHHPTLLDAAHIREDSKGGLPVVTNGIAMCAIHHRAFDASVLGIRPDYVVDVQPRILEEQDGPTLQHALKGMHGLPIQLPVDTAARPDKALLEERYEKFRAAS